MSWKSSSTLAAAAALAFVLSCEGHGPASDEAAGARTPLLLLAIDGLEWSVLLPLLESGELPTFRRWIETGQAGLLESMRPTRSPVIWTTVATGKLPEEHGILDFAREDDNGAPSLYTSRDRRTAALWNMTSALSVPTAVVGWWMTWPVEPVQGVMVAQTNALPGEGPAGAAWKGSLLDGMPDQVWPPERTAEVFGILHDAETRFDDTVRSAFGFVPADLPPLEGHLWRATRWALRADAVYLEVARRLLAEDRYDLAMVYLGGADVIGHRFWRYHEPQLYDHPPEAALIQRFGGFVDGYYRYLDRALGELTGELEGWNILLVSDHGMTAHRRDGMFELPQDLGRLTSGHHMEAPPGVLVATGPGFHRGAAATSLAAGFADGLRAVGTVLDVAPTVLALLGLPVAEDMSGHVLERLLSVPSAARADLPRIASYDGLTGQRTGMEAPPDSTETERLEQLRALGYLGND